MKERAEDPVLIYEYLESIIRSAEKAINALHRRDLAIDEIVASLPKDADQEPRP